MDKKQALAAIDEKSKLIIEVNDTIWANPETAFREFVAMQTLCAALESEGFKVEKGVGDVPTAFTGSFGSGKPVIGFLGEYDALSGLSQEGGSVTKKPIVQGGAGHGCGHNELGAASLAAAIAVKEYLKNNPDKSGTVIFFGTPGEEGGSGKAFMAREGVFDACDACITWHPSTVFAVRSGSNLANCQIEYHFAGVSAHAAGDPHLGRSALDAVELMNLGVQFLREHMIDKARIHYAITNAGGYSPNVVQPTADVLYLIRSPKTPEVLELAKRVEKIAKGAAMMTETDLTINFIKACSNIVPNNVIEKVLYKNFEEVGLPTYTEEERQLCRDIVASYESAGSADSAAGQVVEWGELIAEKQKDDVSINDFLLPYHSYEDVAAGSSDVGDVSWVCPTAQIWAVTWAARSPGHSWQNTAMGNTSVAHKGVISAGKVMGGAGIDLLSQPETLKAAKEELNKRLGGGKYVCPIPKGVKPQAIGAK